MEPGEIRCCFTDGFERLTNLLGDIDQRLARLGKFSRIDPAGRILVRDVLEKLRELARTHSLCLALLGLEKATARGCFGVQIKACRGGCVGLEDRASHDERLFLALKAMQVHAWPHAGAIELVETRGDWVQKHRVQDWRYLGTWCSRVSGLSWGEAETAFDLDTYRILVGPVMARLAGVEASAPEDASPR